MSQIYDYMSSDLGAGAEPVRCLGKLRHRGRHGLELGAFGHSDGKKWASKWGAKPTKIAWVDQAFQCGIFFIAMVTT